jgi:hypothetical protein
MKNVHLITKEQEGADVLHQYLYITSEEAIKEGDWYLIEFNGLKITQCNSVEELISIEGRDDCKKIILTTDQDLIGVQSIDNEFLEWFVKNPSCEEVEIENKKVLVGWEPDYTYEDLGIDGSKNVYHNFYKIIIPQEEPKQETLEEASLRIGLMEIELNHTKTLLASCEKALENRDNQAQRMYSEEEVKEILMKTDRFLRADLDLWFEQFKKK